MSTLNDLYRAIEQAGSVDAYVRAELERRGFLVARREADELSDREREAYKKALKEEAAERRKLRREAWKAYRERHIVHLGEGVFWTDAKGPDVYDHPRAEERAAENELPPLDTPAQLAEALGLTIPQLRRLTYHREAARWLPYRRFTVPKADGTDRAIWAPVPRLKRAQRWILRHVVERLIVHGDAHGFLAGRSIVSNAAAHADPGLLVKVDLKDFFPTVSFRRVKGVFRRAGYRERVATLLALLCTEAPREVVEHGGTTYYVALGPRCLPQGAPTSPAISNLVCRRLDARLAGLAKRAGGTYTRYADDLTFSFPSDGLKVGRFRWWVDQVCQQEGFTVHQGKFHVIRASQRQVVTGLVVNDVLRVPREERRRFRAVLHNCRTHGVESQARGRANFAGWLRGYASYIHMVHPEEGAGLLREVEELLGGEGEE